MKIALIGYGNIAKALAAGLIANTDIEIAVSSPSLPEDKNQRISTHHDNLAILPGSNIIILAVKPVKIAEVLAEIAPAIPESCVLISVAAGVSLEALQGFCGKRQAIVRCMPNLAVAVGKGALPLVANNHVQELQKEEITSLFNSIGRSHWLQDETLLNAFTALSGSGPAYIFLLMESMIAAAVKLGLPLETAQTFTLQTLQGAASLVEQTGLSAGELIKRVTSPGGTTAAALAVLQEGQFETIVADAIEAACQRAQELSLHEGK